MTRKDYMNGKVTHEEYYASVAKMAGVSFVGSDPAFLRKVRRALDRGDEHLNSIPLRVWDMYGAGAQIATAPAFEAHGDFWSIAGGCCVAKTMARRAAMAFGSRVDRPTFDARLMDGEVQS
jgi:hypothetical protein